MLENLEKLVFKVREVRLMKSQLGMTFDVVVRSQGHGTA